MFHRVRLLLQMIRFSHTLFALPPAILGAVMAWTTGAHRDPPVPFRPRDLVGILVCIVFARGAAMALNRLADRRLDALNPRTAMRHLPTGTLSVGSVVVFTVACSLGFVAGTLLFLPHNRIPLLASAPVLLFLFSYSYAKRVTILAHFWLGTALMLAPVAAWVAAGGPIFAAAPWMLGAAIMFWVAGFDMIYACQDTAFDVKMRLFSVPARFGIAAALRLAAVCHVGMIALLFSLPFVYKEFGAFFLGGVACVAVLLAYEHRLVRPDDLTRVNQAFFHVNALVSLGLLAVGAIDLLL